jgi:hypothetical protein
VVQVDPMKPKLEAPGTKRLKLKCGLLLSNSTFSFNLRRYNKAAAAGEVVTGMGQRGGRDPKSAR